MPVIPDLTHTSGAWRPAAPSVSAAMAPGLAMSSIGDGIQDVGSVLGQIGERVQKVRDDDAFTTANLAIMEADAEHQIFRAKNPDPSTWEQNRLEGLAKVREKTQDLPISTDARQRLESFFETTEAKSRFETKVSIAQYEVTKARQNTANLDLEYRKNGNFKAARELQDKAVEGGVYTRVEGQVNQEDISREEIEFHKKSNFQSLYSQINFDPAGAKSFLTEKNPDGSWKNASDMESGARSQLLDQADIQIGKETFAELQLFTHSLGDYNATEAELQTMPNFLDDSQKNAVLANYRRATPPTPDELKTAWDTVDSLRKLKEDPTTSQKQPELYTPTNGIGCANPSDPQQERLLDDGTPCGL